MKKQNKVLVIGGGLAGCESAYQLANRGVEVDLIDIKPSKFTSAHKNPNFAELVCSNSLKSKNLDTASGLLKAELELLDSLIIKTAHKHAVEAGGALAVDRDKFSREVTYIIRSTKNINIVCQEQKDININIPTIIATGPLTTDDLADSLKKLISQDYLYFFDAASPIVTAESIDYNSAFWGSRYQKGGDDYLNCPMTKQEYELFYNELINAKTVQLKSFEGKEVFEGCIPIEIMAKRGIDTLRFGPLRPVGLKDDMGKRPYAVVQLRAENREKTLFNLVGFQTNLTFPEQARVFSLIPALKSAQFVRYGVMHRNTFINAPNCVNEFFQLKNYPNIFIAGQLSGVEGYVESVCSGLIAGVNMYKYINGVSMTKVPQETMTGALINYITTPNVNFQPMNANFGILPPLKERIKDKRARFNQYSQRALAKMCEFCQDCDINDKIS
ncbi:MAG TPA: methylenetetrahydrofolate--tRNA-(uracil(54)-C(5))-methyltransferase (FADH(2)-oxidizing) TrmFO [Clostridiales bacterium]|nr:methylenetetrahydrofolate--tRNA-(uracil(54)-C(5))-methyltransferase (FADH(2)-oxidizing) TrmFO [Clostridiales bacterium]